MSKLRKIRQQNLAAMETWQRRKFIGVISGLAAAIERPKFHLAPFWYGFIIGQPKKEGGDVWLEFVSSS